MFAQLAARRWFGQTALALVVALLVGLGAASPASAQPTSPPASTQPTSPPASTAPAKLRVGTHPIAPFIIKNPDGTWGGISMELWHRLARELGLAYEVVDLEPKALMAAGKAGELDVLVSLNITERSEADMDLTHAFYSTGLAIAVRPSADDGLLGTVKAIFTGRFVKAIGGLAVVLIVIGGLMWLLERRRNPEQFGGSSARGIGNGVWWSAVTMTTVGYGDRSPVTLGGRVLGLVWMFAAIIMISGFTASISSALTVSRLESSVTGPDDLPKATVGAVEPSQAARYCQRKGITYRGFATAEEALAALDRGELEAVVGEAPILAYAARTQFGGRVTMLPGTFENHGYGFGLRTGSTLREPLNLALLRYVAGPEWPVLLTTLLGPQ